MFSKLRLQFTSTSVQVISLVDVMTSSINLNADWSIVSRPPVFPLMHIVQYVNINRRQSHVVHLQYIKYEWTINHSDCPLMQG